MKNTINWGIIGPGKIAKKFATDIRVVKNARLHAVASRSLEKAQEFARTFAAPHAFGSYEDLLTCPDLDAIYIATPHTSHHDHALLCLEAGLGVLCEKPFAVNEQQVQAMVQKAKEKEVFLMEAMWTRFLPTMSKTKTLLKEGVIGDLLSIRADFGFKAPYDSKNRIFNPNLAGGALLDIGIYPVFLALFLMGYPDEINVVARIGETGVDEEIGIIFNYHNGQMAHLHATVLAKTNTEAFIYGRKGTIHLPERWFNPTDIVLSFYDDRPSEKITFDYQSGGFEYEIEAASQAMLLGKAESEKMPLRFSIQLIRLLDAIRREIGLVYPMEVS
ncbi:MAG: Gfo/Idh/MocA family oxidoreductase [Bacteroidota bacterium]